MSFFAGFLFFVFILLLIFYLKNTYNKYKIGYLSFQNVGFDEVYPKGKFTMFADPEGQFTNSRENCKKFGKSYRQWFFKFGMIFNCVQAKDVEKVILSPMPVKKSFTYKFASAFLQDGLVISHGEKWLKRRRILTPAFHFNILQQFYIIFKEHCGNFLNDLKKDAENDKTTSIQTLAAKFTFESLGETAMGVNLESEFHTYRKSMHEAIDLLLYRSFRPWLHSDSIFFSLDIGKKFQEALNVAHSFTKSVVNARRKTFADVNLEDQKDEENIYLSKKKRFAMMDTLLIAERRGEIDEAGICEETDTFMFTGHDTTSVAITFALFLLSHHPEAQQKIFEEIQETLSSKDEKTLDMNDLNNLKYLDCAVKECLRIYPPVPSFSRVLTEDLDMHGLILPKGVIIRVQVLDLHRDPEQFPDPMKFDPDRFLPENVAKRHPFAYVPFSAGPRNCIGQRFALLELKVAVSEILQKFEMIPVTNPEDLVFELDMTLRTKDPIKIKFKLR